MAAVSPSVEQVTPPRLEAEWERVELLAHCARTARQGNVPDAQQMQRLRELQSEVQRLRAEGQHWLRLPVSGLTRMEMDVLAVVLAAEVDPRIAWVLQSMQSDNSHPHPTPALLQELLALQDEEIGDFRSALLPTAELQSRRLLQLEDNDPRGALRAGRGITATLLQWPQFDAPPPGARLVNQRAAWDDLILADDRIRALKEFLYWIRHRDTVVGQWGGVRTGGPVALFAGPSGTGKTFAAVVLACELGWPLYRVDLGRLVSKYIGDTEKNINRLFDAADDREMVLQFDEADSLMSKRGEVKEARDRFANMQVSHLLARIEDHRGPCILTTNLRTQLDSAFYRRLQVVVEFPRPDAEARARLWRRLLPPRAPLAATVDCDALGQGVRMSGGSIRNAALHAAYLAAEHGQAIDQRDIAIAVWRELAKDGREVRDSDMGALLAHLPPAIRPAVAARARKLTAPNS